MSTNQNNKILEECLIMYKNKLDLNKLPMNSKELKKINENTIEYILAGFHNRIIGDNYKNAEERLLEEIKQRFKLFNKKNNSESKKISENFLEKCRLEIKKELKNSTIKTQYDLKNRLALIKESFENNAGPSSNDKDKIYIEWYQKI